MEAVRQFRVHISAMGVAAVLLLSGCASSGDPVAETTSATPTPTRTASPTPTATPTPTPTPTPDGKTYQFTCNDADYKKFEFATMEAVWASGMEFKSCDAFPTGNTYSAEQKEIFAVSGYTDIQAIVYLYETCALPTMGYATSPTTPYSEGQVKEIQAALMVCPTNPAAGQVQAIIADTVATNSEDARLRAEKKRVGNGTFRVGADIVPGTYVFEGEVKNCYWETLDAAGNIIANNFVTSGLRIEAYVNASDFSFSSQGCGIWTLQE